MSRDTAWRGVRRSVTATSSPTCGVAAFGLRSWSSMRAQQTRSRSQAFPVLEPNAGWDGLNRWLNPRAARWDWLRFFRAEAIKLATRRFRHGDLDCAVRHDCRTDGRFIIGLSDQCVRN
jgi:hypothetical protein